MPKTSVAGSTKSRSLSSSPRAIYAIIALAILYIRSSIYSNSKSNLFRLGRKIYLGVSNTFNDSMSSDII